MLTWIFLHNTKDRNIQKLYKRLIIKRLLNCQSGQSCAGLANLTNPEVLMIPRNNYYQINLISVHSELVVLRIKHEPKIPWGFSLVRILQLPRQMCFFFHKVWSKTVYVLICFRLTWTTRSLCTLMSLIWQ